ncbi:type VII secretion protein EccCa [Jatrophihabitans sp. GAS493]|uniref:type VII secretion protein EccCa n=1 Tax=Jatrophihabitans sp. GAS493 TaxID=1907575 RepID=UPI0018D51AFC|nr:type VII secretion protein EccCa [Jatrophihabitans sp. GAS493]
MTIAAPPTLPEARAGSPAIQLLLPIVGAVSSMTMMITLRRSPLMVAAGVLMMSAAVLGAGAMLASQRGQAARTCRTLRSRYLDYLDEVRAQLQDEESQHRAAALTSHPDPSVLAELIRSPSRLWERRRADPDFLRLRIGVGEVPWRDIEVRDESSPLQPTDPFMTGEARTLAERFHRRAGMPIAIDLDSAGDVALVGSRRATLRAARGLASQLMSLHSPHDVSIALACPPEHAQDWGWLLWAPHAAATCVANPVSEPRTSESLRELAQLLDDDLKRRAELVEQTRYSLSSIEPAVIGQRLLIFADRPRAANNSATLDDVAEFARLPLPDATLDLPTAGITLIHLLPDHLGEPETVRVRITVGDDGSVVVEDLRAKPAKHSPVSGAAGPGYERVTGVLDDVSPARAEALARYLAPLRPDSANLGVANPLIDPPDNAAILGVDDLSLPNAWKPRSPRDFLRVPIGTDDSGGAVMLDLKESAQLGMGPHGLCVGATGSGKSELLRTLIAALAVTHPPDDLALLLVDYKGGAAFAPLARLPHVCGLITNLSDDQGLIERAHASLAGEVLRRQTALKRAGDLADIGQYRQLRAASRPDLPSLPHLLVVIDEFAELLAAQEEFVDLFLTIGRIGRSIGIHLLLASQRIETGRLRGLETYLSYRLALRTFSEAESTMVLDSPDAYRLPPVPGFGWLKVDSSVYTRFRAAYVSGRAAERASPQPAADPAAARPILHLPFYAGLATGNGTSHDDVAIVERRTVEATLLDSVAEAIERLGGQPVDPIWLPPLPGMLTLDQVIGRPAAVPGRGLQTTGLARPAPSELRAVIGLVDDPRQQRQYPWSLDLTAAGGHVAIVGGPQSGKSNLLRAIAVSLALTYTPEEVSLYGLDLGSGGLSRLRQLPHVGGVATRNDRERLNRTVAELRRMIDERQEIFRVHSIDSVEQLRAERAAGRPPSLPASDLVLLIDDAGALRSDLESLEPAVTDLITRGSGVGLHVIAAVTRWNELRMGDQAAYGTRIELRLNEPGDSVVSRRLADAIRPDQRGRVVTEQHRGATDFGHPTTAQPLYAQAALARTDAQASATGLLQALEEAGRASAAAWPGRRAEQIRVLPPMVRPEELPDFIDEPDLIPIGVSETTLEPALLDLFDVDQHLLVLGDTRSGKTTLLRAIAGAVTDRRSEQELVVAVVNQRRGLSGAVSEAHLGGYASSAAQAEGLAHSIAAELARRSANLDDPTSGGAPGTDRGAPLIVLIVDDYELLTAAGSQPLGPLLPYLPAARDLGLHVVLARPVAGASRGIWDGFVQGLRDGGAVGLLMDGDRSEGQLFPGTYPSRQPPGRGLLVRRGEAPQLVQTALHPSARPVGRAR